MENVTKVVNIIVQKSLTAQYILIIILYLTL